MQAAKKQQKKQQEKNAKSPAGGADLASLMDAIPPGTPEGVDLPAITLPVGVDDHEAFEEKGPESPVFTIHASQEVPPVALPEAQAAAPIAPPAVVRSKSLASGLRRSLGAKAANVHVSATPPLADVVADDPLRATAKVHEHAHAMSICVQKVAPGEQKRLDVQESELETTGKKKSKRVTMAPKSGSGSPKKALRSILKKPRWAPPAEEDGNDGDAAFSAADAAEEDEGGAEGFDTEEEEEDDATVAIQDAEEDPVDAAFDEQLTNSAKSKKNTKSVAAPKSKKAAAAAPVPGPVRGRGEPSTGKTSKRKAGDADHTKPAKASKAKSKKVVVAAAAAAAADATEPDDDDDEEAACDVDAILANPRNSRVCNIVSSDGQAISTRNACKYANGCTYTLIEGRSYAPCAHSSEVLAKPNEGAYARVSMDNFLHFELQGKPQKSSQPRVLSFFIDSESQLVTCSRPMLMKLLYNDFGRDYSLMRKRYLDWAKRGNCDTDAQRTDYRVPPVFFTAKDLANRTDKDFPKLDTLDGYVTKKRGAPKKRRLDTSSVAATSVAGSDNEDDDDDDAEDDDIASTVAPSVRGRSKAPPAPAAAAAKRARPQAAAAAAAAAAADPGPQLTPSRLPVPSMVGALPSLPAIHTVFDVNAAPLRGLKLHTRSMGPGSQLLMGMLLGNPIARLIQEVGDMCRTELDTIIMADILNRRRITIEATRRRLANELDAAAAPAPAAASVGPIPLRGAQVADQLSGEMYNEDEEAAAAAGDD